MVLSLRDISKSYAGRRVVHRVTFSEREGQIVGLVGPNGAGKTTLIRIIMGILAPQEGRLEVLGTTDPAEIRQKVGYLPEERGLYQKQPVRDVLRYLAALKGLDRHTADQRAAAWLDRLGIPDTHRRQVRELSKGMQQKVQFIAAVLHDPELLLLDEPFGGLDPVSRQQLRATLRQLAASGKTILLSSHEMAEVELLCPEVVMVHLGRVVLAGAVDAIKRQFGEHAVLVKATGELGKVPGVARLAPHDGLTKVILTEECEDSEFLARAQARGVRFDHFEVALPSLEDVFVRLVKQTGSIESCAAPQTPDDQAVDDD